MVKKLDVTMDGLYRNLAVIEVVSQTELSHINEDEITVSLSMPETKIEWVEKTMLEFYEVQNYLGKAWAKQKKRAK